MVSGENAIFSLHLPTFPNLNQHLNLTLHEGKANTFDNRADVPKKLIFLSPPSPYAKLTQGRLRRKRTPVSATPPPEGGKKCADDDGIISTYC